jgi:hypothetical protein
LISELSSRGVTRIIRGHPGFQVLIDLHFEVEAHFLFHLALQTSSADQGEQPAPELSD